jgi:hypothetical protein
VRAFVDYLVEVLDADKSLQQECPLRSEIAALAAQNQVGQGNPGPSSSLSNGGLPRTKSPSNIETA